MYYGDDLATIVLAGFRGFLGEGLRQAIERDGQLQVHLHEGSDEDELSGLSALVEELQPGVVLLQWEALDSPVALRRLVLAHPGASVAVAVPHERRERDEALLAAGARAIVPLTVEAEQLRGLLWFLARGLVGFAARPVRDLASGVAMLTGRETQVLELLLEGRSGMQVAQALRVSMATVNSHRYRIYEKLGVHSRRELAMYASELRGAPATPAAVQAPRARDRVAYAQRARQAPAGDRAAVIDFGHALGARRWPSR